MEKKLHILLGLARQHFLFLYSSSTKIIKLKQYRHKKLHFFFQMQTIY